MRLNSKAEKIPKNTDANTTVLFFIVENLRTVSTNQYFEFALPLVFIYFFISLFLYLFVNLPFSILLV